jgi:hypothetical protein
MKMSKRKKGLAVAGMKLSKRKKGMAVAGVLTAFEALALQRRQGKVLGFRTIVRCRRGHLFTTVWIPGASLKSLRLGPWRYQRCPVEGHWSLVSLVKTSKLSDEDRELAESRRDTLLP